MKRIKWQLYGMMIEVLVIIALLVWVGYLLITKTITEISNHKALSAYAYQTQGHLERYVSGSHLSYSGKYPVEVQEWSERITYPNKPTYYPEDHDEWKTFLH